MKIYALPNSEIKLVHLIDSGNIGRLTPHCKEHGAMNKMTEDGIWRCVSHYQHNWKTGRTKENACLAGCQERQSK